MPLRDMDREQMWLLPPSLDELLPLDHPARFVAVFVDALDKEGWAELGGGDRRRPSGSAGLPSSGTALRVAVWLHDRGAFLSQAGGGLPGPDTVFVADRMAASGPQHLVAVLQRAQAGYEETVQAHSADSGGNAAGEPSGSSGGRDESGGQRHKG